MTVDAFAIWKFKNIEGLIECNGYDFQTTKIKKGLDTYFIKYDLKTEEATIENGVITYEMSQVVAEGVTVYMKGVFKKQ